MQKTVQRIYNDRVYIKNLKPINNDITKCDIMVLYEGLNRNGSYLSEEVINNYIAPSLPNKPIVGFFDTETNDFLGHEQELVIDPSTKKISVRYITVPFGMIASDTEVWWESVVDVDGEVRKYLMCQGYIWNGRYPQTKDLIENGKSISMELNPTTLKGYWTKDSNTGVEYYNITEAYIDAICILGDAIEPCFEGANITPTNYNVNEIKEFEALLKEALQYRLSEKGGENMEVNQNDIITTEENVIIEEVDNGQNDIIINEENTIMDDGQNYVISDEENIVTVEEENGDVGQDNIIQEEENIVIIEEDGGQDNVITNEENIINNEEVLVTDDTNFEKADELDTPALEVIEEKSVEESNYHHMYNELMTKHLALEKEYELMSARVLELQNKLNKYILIEKEDVINKYTELNEEDVADIKANLEKYTVEEIDTILAAKAYKKMKETFSLNSVKETEKEPTIVYSLVNDDKTAPMWVKALINKKKTF